MKKDASGEEWIGESSEKGQGRQGAGPVHKNLPASVRQRLTNLAKSRGIEFQRMLVLYALERLLYRLSVSPFAHGFILKGASLFLLWFEEPHRRTRDLDLLGKDTLEPKRLAALFEDLCRMEAQADGLRFLPETVHARPIRDQNEFGGVRVTLTALLENARIAVQVDIGFGDETVPRPEEAEFPTMLPDFPAPRLMVYQKETTIAEKLHAIVILERANSRMKDFFDLYVLSQEFAFTSERLTAAILDTFARRGTPLPATVPDGLTQDFATDAAKLVQWKAFLSQNVSPPRNSLTITEVITQVATFVLPVLESVRTGSSNDLTVMIWKPGGPWQEEGTG